MLVVFAETGTSYEPYMSVVDMAFLAAPLLLSSYA